MNWPCRDADIGAGLYDRTVPVLLFQVSQYALLYGALGAIRSLGRAGILCHAIETAPLSPHTFSRYVSKCHKPQDRWADRQDSLLKALRGIAREVGRPAMLLPIDDESAIFAAEHRGGLSPEFILPQVPPSLPGKLARKHGLAEACAHHGIPTPRTSLARTLDEALMLAGQTGYPVVIKNSDPWCRLSSPVVPSTTVFRNARELVELRYRWPAMGRAIVQEYIPDAEAEDWIVHVYCGSSAAQSLVFTGRKYRSWPPCGGVTTAASAIRNEALAEMAARFCRETGFKGIADMDWRLDRRDGQYKMVDFNPRLGANFGLFQTEAGLDVVRAQHLDLTGREIPTASPIYGRQFRVENLDWASRMAPSNAGRPQPDRNPNRKEYAWLASDDPMPFIVMLVKFTWLAAQRMAALAASRLAKMPGRIGHILRDHIASHGQP